MPRQTVSFERRASSRSEPPSPIKVDLSGLEDQLRRITSQIETLRPVEQLEKAIAALRSDLSDIGRSLTEALPRRAVESLEIEIKALAERIDHSRQSGADGIALTGLERGLAEVREALNGLTTSESLIGVEEAVLGLSRKVDSIATSHDPAALQQLEEAIAALRGILNHVASNDTLTKVAEDVRSLAARVDDVANMAASGEALSALESRIDTLTTALHASNEVGHAVPRELERLIGGLIEKLEWIQLTHTDHAALGHLEDRIATLVKRLDVSDSRLSHLDAIERGLADLLVHIDQMRGSGSSDGASRTAPVVDALKRDVDEIRNSERRTRDSIEAVHETVAQVVDRLAMIEGGIRGDAAGQSNSAFGPDSGPDSLFERDFAPPTTLGPAPAPVPAKLVAVAPIPPAPPREPPSAPPPAKAGPRAPIDPSLPPDHPLEPGSASARPRTSSPADRIADSEAALGHSKPPVIPEGGKSNFIAAARKAAQAAAMAAPSPAPGPRAPTVPFMSLPKKFAARLRTLIVATSVAAIVVGGVHVVSRLFDDGGPTVPSSKAPEAESTAGAIAVPKPAPATPQSAPSPAPPPTANPATGRQSMLQGAGATWPSQIAGLPAGSGNATADASLDFGGPLVTGSITQPAQPPAVTPPAAMPASIAALGGSADKLPAAIGGPNLRAAAINGDAGAAYEVALRFSEGRGVPQNTEAAAHWFERAAKLGLAPAQFRLGGFYEKGIGVKKDLAAARDLYVAAADQGNVKAMHNLAVLYAEGIDGKPDYRASAQWFRKAADHGLADSQYNLAILYARGIGVETNMAEAYKWFTIAAKEGDKEAAKKRDEVAGRLDPQSLAAARTAVQSWSVQAQPEGAVNVNAPAGGWDHPAAGAKPKPRPSSAKAG